MKSNTKAPLKRNCFDGRLQQVSHNLLLDKSFFNIYIQTFSAAIFLKGVRQLGFHLMKV